MIKDTFHLKLRGGAEILIDGKSVMREHNIICDSAIDMLLGLFGADVENKLIAYIAIGTGGDYSPYTGMDAGARFEPKADETTMRQEICRCPIAHVETDDLTKESTMTAVALPEQASSTGINELGLLTVDGTMVAHFVTPADMTGRATKYVKEPGLLNMVTRWRLTPSIHRG